VLDNMYLDLLQTAVKLLQPVKTTQQTLQESDQVRVRIVAGNQCEDNTAEPDRIRVSEIKDHTTTATAPQGHLR
jgi:DNA-directed RNA polymerase subunit E'/Rpb7